MTVRNTRKALLCQFEEYKKAQQRMGTCGEPAVVMIGNTPLCYDCAVAAAFQPDYILDGRHVDGPTFWAAVQREEAEKLIKDEASNAH